MTSRLVLDVVGVRVEVVATGPGPMSGSTELDAAVHEALLGGPADCSVEVPGHDLEGMLGAVARAAIEHSPRLLVHAGAVARDGQAVLFPGMSGTGKSTMTAACLRRGFDYLTDEMVAVEPRTGHVAGWPRPLMLTPWSMRQVGLPVPAEPAPPGKLAVPYRAFGAAVVAAAVPVAHVVVLRRVGAGAGLAPMPASELLAELLGASFNHYRYGAAAWEATAEVARQARGWYLNLADVEAAADTVAELIP